MPTPNSYAVPDYSSLNTYAPQLSSDYGSGAFLDPNYGNAANSVGATAVSPGGPISTQGPSGGGAPTGFNPYIQGIQALGGIANVALGFKGLDLARDQFAFSKDSFNKNLANQSQVINTQLEDQQRARLAGTGTYDRNTEAGRASLQQDLESYVAANRVSGTAV